MNNCDCKCDSCKCQPKFVAIQTADSLERFANCYVRVISTNTTYFVDSCHEIFVVSAGPVFVSNYDAKTNKLGLANQVCYDFANNIAYAFDSLGQAQSFALEEVA